MSMCGMGREEARIHGQVRRRGLHSAATLFMPVAINALTHPSSKATASALTAETTENKEWLFYDGNLSLMWITLFYFSHCFEWKVGSVQLCRQTIWKHAWFVQTFTVPIWVHFQYFMGFGCRKQQIPKIIPKAELKKQKWTWKYKVTFKFTHFYKEYFEIIWFLEKIYLSVSPSIRLTTCIYL